MLAISPSPLTSTVLRTPRKLRHDLHENQTVFWSRFGITQSQGSRYEQGMNMSLQLIILLSLYVDGKLTDEDLWMAKESANIEAPHDKRI